MAELTYEKALERISRICSRREKCVQDVLRKLKSWELEEKTIQRILKYLKEKDFVNDKRYAQAYTYNQYHFRKWGKIKISLMLKQKQINETLIDDALEKLDKNDYMQTLKEEMKKKRKMLKGGNRYDLMVRLQRFAYSRGYEPDIVHKIMDDVLENE